MEASSHGLKQHRLDGLQFSTGIFTNFSHDHLDYHKTMKDYFNSKMILFKNNLKKKSDVIISSKINEFKKSDDPYVFQFRNGNLAGPMQPKEI